MKAVAELREKIKALGPLGRSLLPFINEIEAEFKNRDRRMSTMSAVSRVTPLLATIDSQEDVNQVLNKILDSALKLSQAERGFIVLADAKEPDGFRISASKDVFSHGNDLSLAKNLIKQILERRKGTLLQIEAQDRPDPKASVIITDSVVGLSIRSVMATPIILFDQVIGGIYVDTRISQREFTQDDLLTLENFSHYTAVAFNIATSIKAKRELHVQSVLALVNAIEAADAYTAGHSSRVGYYARGIGRTMGLPPVDLDRLAFAGYLHDVGKIALKASVNKLGKLTDEEWQEFKRHPVIGESILRNSPALSSILPAVRHHHERPDGHGYPDGISGNAIHLYARIVSVSDSFDAMTTDRSYRKALSVEYALGEIRKNINSQFHADAAHAFLDAFASGNLVHAMKTQEDEELVLNLAGL